MSEFAALYQPSLLVFLFVLARIGGLILLAPVWGGRQLPLPTRLLLMLAIALLIAPLHVNAHVPPASQPWQILITFGREAILGLMLGLGLLVITGGLQIAGQLIAQISGLSLGELLDPQLGGETSPLGKCFEVVAIASFLLIGGHRQVLAALLDTFSWLPPGAPARVSGLWETLVEILSQSFVLGLRAAAPVMVSVLLSTLVLGLVSRAWPQLHAFTIGFSLNALVAVAVLSLTLGSAAWVYQEHTEAAVEALRSAFAAIGQGDAT